jgi:hypothetical protein
MMLLFALLAAALVAAVQACNTDFDCSLNGVCSAGGTCTCDSPWGGAACSTLQYKVTPAGAKNVWTGDENLNTWSGPILHDAAAGKYHLIDPVYEHGSLWNVIYIAHGVATSPTGPYDWTTLPNISHAPTINPGGLVFPNASAGGAPVYSIWLAGDIMTSMSADGPYVARFKYPGGAGGNPAPAFHAGNFYLTDQSTSQILTTPSLDQPWTKFAAISHPAMQCTVEDPTMFFDRRGSVHIINHCYNTGQRTNCTNSWVSSHFFSTDGQVWGHSDQPYSHTVQFDDGTEHSFCTLERPGLTFDASGLITHLNVAADLITQDEGCASRGKGCVDVRAAGTQRARARALPTWARSH